MCGGTTPEIGAAERDYAFDGKVVTSVRALVASALSLGLVVGCLPQLPPDAKGSANPSAAPSAQGGGVGASCAPAIPVRGRGTATLTELPHEIGASVLFGLDGSFLASAPGYPLKAQWRWFELDNDGKVISRFEWRWQGGMLQSPDGSKVVYGVATDATSGRTALFIRDMLGPGRLLAPINGAPLRWLDTNLVLVETFDDVGVIHSVDTRTGADRIVFSPPPPPGIKAEGDNDFFDLSGDLRWAVFTRGNAAGSVLRQDLFDVERHSYVPGVTLPTKPIALAPTGDMALWLDGNQLRAMHLCDRRVVTLGTIATATDIVNSRWSADGRFASFSFGSTNEETGPERVTFVDLQQGALAEIDKPWGFVRQWSPDGRFVVLSRSGYHSALSKLARFDFK
jgi:hypothetical protein